MSQLSGAIAQPPHNQPTWQLGCPNRERSLFHTVVPHPKHQGLKDQRMR